MISIRCAKTQYDEVRNDKIRKSKLGLKRKYLPDCSYIMVNKEVEDGR